MLSVPSQQLGSFGQGIALYFSTLLAVAVLTFIAGCASIYSMVYFASDKYDANPENNLPLLQRGSAVCNDTSVSLSLCTLHPQHFRRFLRSLLILFVFVLVGPVPRLRLYFREQSRKIRGPKGMGGGTLCHGPIPCRRILEYVKLHNVEFNPWFPHLCEEEQL